MINLLVVEDNELMQAIYRALLEESKGYKVVDCVDNGFDAIESYKKLKPDVVIMDVEMKGCSGVRASKKIMAYDKNAKIIILTASPSEFYLKTFKAMGINCFLYKEDVVGKGEKIFKAIDAAFNNKRYLSESFIHLIYELIGKKAGTALGVLTASEFDVMYMLGTGMSKLSISNSMNITVGTVETHMANSFKKLDVFSVEEFMGLAKSCGIDFSFHKG